ncbi:extracellular leucine-rich repeat and fibronectin type III domain containing 2a [Pygocentrus nattereri]|uniref:extracellular leucine-rich repeat and fibronectin type III domain containing 2a n=1 Tax=Pygocentrus nattereri TaxID=42514 RepID=UPI0008143B72|nr:extracellular leucine-rich repeat and fibronectin type III domain containing 2a [Pygocentrus nattereri]XP_037390174.1 extracellular leucine-rich repeat and fibronectin type III domain containing 2a [Pygocentrus nattereri]
MASSRFSLPKSSPSALSLLFLPLLFLPLPSLVRGDCWLIEGDKGYVWLAICSQNQPPYETIPQHINNTVHDLRLNENKLKAIFFSSMSRFTNLTDLNLTKNEISYIEDGAFAAQANLQVLQLGYNKLTNLTEGMLRGLGRMQCLFLQHNLIEVISTNAFWECPSLSSLDLSSNKLAKLDPSTFTVLGRLMVCELAGNPFHCGCELYSFLTWLEAFNNVTHTYDRLQCETPRELFGYPLLSPVSSHGRNARSILSSMCKDGVIIPGITSLPPEVDFSGIGPDNSDQMGPFHPPTASSTAGPSYSPTIKLQSVSLTSASLLVQIPRPYSKMYILVQYNHTYVSDVMNLKNKKELVTLKTLKPHTDYTFCVASIRNSQRYNHTCLQFATRSPGPDDLRAGPSTTTHYIMTILGCLFGMLIVLGLVYYCLRRRRIQEEKEKSISVKKTILEMRYGPEAAAAAANDPSALQKLHEQVHHQHHHSKMPQSTSSSLGMLHSSANTSSSRLSSLPQVEKMATAFSEALATSKGNYMDVRTSAGGEERARDGAVPGAGENIVMEENGIDAGEDSEDDGRGSTSEISTIAKEVDKVNQIINNCIDALKFDSVAVAAAAAAATTTENPSSPPPQCITSSARGLIPLSPTITETCQLMSSPKMPPLPPVPLVLPLSERPGISGGGFLSPPYRDPPPATAARPLQRQLSADAAVVVLSNIKNRCGASSGGSIKSARVFSLDVPEPLSPDSSKFPEKGSPVGCGEPLERLPLVVVQGGSNGRGEGGNGGGGGGGGGSGGSGGCGVVGPGGGGMAQQHLLEVHPDYHCSEHRHSFPALYYEGAIDSPAQKASFLKPLSRTKRDAAYSQLSPRHHNYSGYSSSPEYSSETTLKIWERFRPYKKSPREEAYIAAGHALRKKVQFAKDEDLHDILDYWKGVSAQQKL